MDRKKLKELKRKREVKKQHNLTRGKSEPKYITKYFDGDEPVKVKRG
jgi:hypothetical protein